MHEALHLEGSELQVLLLVALDEVEAAAMQAQFLRKFLILHLVRVSWVSEPLSQLSQLFASHVHSGLLNSV